MPVFIQNRQRAVPVRLGWLREFAALVLPECLAAADGPLAALPEIEVALVSDRVVARVHRDFMGLPEATDVITFEHGEIVASAETARARAAEFGHRVEEEIALYIVHGLLHLNGFDDVAPRDAARMRKIQERIWQEGRARLPFPT